MKKIIGLLLLVQSGFLIAQTETVLTPNGKKVLINPKTINTANNGLTRVLNNVQLGGILVKPTVLATTDSFTLAIKGLQTGDVTDKLLVMGTDGVLKAVDQALDWNEEGNLGTNFATNFIGTVDDEPLQFKINNTHAGKIIATSTSFGYNALIPVPTDIGNTAFGIEALTANKYGISNTAFGYAALSFKKAIPLNNGNGSYNSAFGSRTLTNNTFGTDNIAIGSGAMENNDRGNYNVAIGKETMSKGIYSSYNVAVGDQALKNNVGQGYNIAVGYNTASSNSAAGATGNNIIGANAFSKSINGSYTVAIGYNAQSLSTTGNNIGIGSYSLNKVTGSNNIAVGNNGLANATSGYNNIAFGDKALTNFSGSSGYTVGMGALALSNLTTGTQTTALGYNAGSVVYGTSTPVTSAGTSVFIGSHCSPAADNQTNQVVIGYAAKGRGSNTVQIGNTNITKIEGQVAWSTASDVRLKKDIKSSEFGLNFITKLRPVTYHMKSGVTGLQTGFIAQEVEAAANSINYPFSGVVKPNSDDDFYSLRYSDFVVPLVKAVQEQQKEVAVIDTKLSDIESHLQKLENIVNELTKKK